MNALAELRKRAGTAAIPAIPATYVTAPNAESQKSQESQATDLNTRFSASASHATQPESVLTLKGERLRLLGLAAAEWIEPAHVHRLHDDEVEMCLDLDDGQCVIFLRQLVDTATRHSGRAPDCDIAPVHCHHCGPVWLDPALAAVLPVVAGWPQALGCPWCHVRNRQTIPRPKVRCGECRNFIRDPINPAGGMGTCAAMHLPALNEPLYYPNAQRECDSFCVCTIG